MLQTTIRPELLPDIFHIAIPTNLCRAQFMWYLMQIFLLGSGWKNKSNFLKFTSASNCCWRILWRIFPCFVCLKHILLLGTEYLSSAVADGRCHPAVLLHQQWLSGTPKAKFPVSVLEKKKENKRKCEFTLQCFKGYIGKLCSACSYLRKMQIQAFPWQ